MTTALTTIVRTLLDHMAMLTNHIISTIIAINEFKEKIV